MDNENMQSKDETASKRQFKGGPDAGKQTQFSSTRQPSGAAKSKGKLKRKIGSELTRAILEMGYTGSLDGKLKNKIAAYFGVEPDDITVDMIMDFRQIELAVSKSSTQAYNAVKAQAYGTPKQYIDHTTKGETINPPSTVDYDRFNEQEYDEYVRLHAIATGLRSEKVV